MRQFDTILPGTPIALVPSQAGPNYWIRNKTFLGGFVRMMLAAGIFLLSVGFVGTAQAQDFEAGIQGLSESEISEISQVNFGFGIEIGRVYTCRAQNLRGHVFVGQARDKYMAQRRAISQCYNFGSRQCNLIGCKGKWNIGVGNDDYDRGGRGWPGRR
jgi:hypothetical protein